MSSAAIRPRPKTTTRWHKHDDSSRSVEHKRMAEVCEVLQMSSWISALAPMSQVGRSRSNVVGVASSYLARTTFSGWPRTLTEPFHPA